MNASWRVLLLLLVYVEAAVLALLEVFFLPMRFDGSLLPRISDLPFPVSIAVAIVTTPLLVMLASWLAESTGAAATPLMVWFFTIFVLGFFEPGQVSGIGFLLDDWRTLLLMAGGMLPGAVAVGAVMARNAANRPGLYETAGVQ